MMEPTNLWLIRHALVEENARAILYGTMDVELCPTTLVEQAPMYRALAERLPRPAAWVVTPLSRTRRTAEAIFAAGYPEQTLTVEPGLIEQHLGDWQGLVHAELPARLAMPKHPFAGRRDLRRDDRPGWPGNRGAGGAACRAGRGGGEPWRGDPRRGGALPAHRCRQRAAPVGP